MCSFTSQIFTLFSKDKFLVQKIFFMILAITELVQGVYRLHMQIYIGQIDPGGPSVLGGPSILGWTDRGGSVYSGFRVS